MFDVLPRAIGRSSGQLHGDHLALGGVQIFGRLVELFVVREPRAQPFRTKTVYAKDVRREADLLFGFVEEFAKVVRQLIFPRNREPTDLLFAHCLRLPSKWTSD